MNPDAAAFHDLHDLQATHCRPDPEARLAELARAAGPLRRVAAAIAGRLVAREGWKRLGYARLGDYARERLGRSARSLQDWARVDRGLATLPGVEHALVDGTLAWSKARLLARVATPEDEAAWLAYARSQPVRALERAVRAADRGALEARGGARLAAGGAEGGNHDAMAVAEPCDEPRAWVRIPASFAVALQWQRLRKAAPRVAGQSIPPDAVLEMVTAEVLSALPLSCDAEVPATKGRLAEPLAAVATDVADRPKAWACAGERRAVWLGTSGGRVERPSGPCELPPFLRALAAGLVSADARGTSPDEASGASTNPSEGSADPPDASVDPPDAFAVPLDSPDSFELDARLRCAVRLEQRLEAELGPLLRQVSAPDYEWKGRHTSLAAFARERLGMSPRKLRALLQVERAADACPALRAAYRDGGLSWLQALWLARLLARDAEGSWRERWVEFAQRVSVRRLEECVESALALREAAPDEWARCRERPDRIDEPGLSAPAAEAEAGGRQVCAPPGAEGGKQAGSEQRCRITLTAPAEVARLFDATLCSVRLAMERETGRLPSAGEAFGAMLEHAARSWALDDPWLGGRKPGAVRIFERDGWRCTVPGCSSRRNLHAHHIVYRSRGGGDEDANQVTLCAFHHLRGVHGGVIAVRGRAPEALVFELGCRPGRAPLERFGSGDRRIGA